MTAAPVASITSKCSDSAVYNRNALRQRTKGRENQATKQSSTMEAQRQAEKGQRCCTHQVEEVRERHPELVDSLLDRKERQCLGREGSENTRQRRCFTFSTAPAGTAAVASFDRMESRDRSTISFGSTSVRPIASAANSAAIRNSVRQRTKGRQIKRSAPWKRSERQRRESCCALTVLEVPQLVVELRGPSRRYGTCIST